MEPRLEDAGIDARGRRLRQRARHLDAAQRRGRDRALKTALGDARYKIPISSLKSAIGHLLGAAGAVEAVATLLALRDRIAPPTLGLRARARARPRLRPASGQAAGHRRQARDRDLVVVRLRRHNACSLGAVCRRRRHPRTLDSEGKKLLITGVINRESIAFEVASRRRRPARRSC
jgi:hypothetical protein